MKLGLLGLILLQGAIGAIVRKPPAFSTPVLSDSYLPAAMQVIFHAVEQLKHLEAEEAFEKPITLPPLLNTAQPNPQDTSSPTPSSTTTTTTTTTMAEDEAEDKNESKEEGITEDPLAETETPVKITETLADEVGDDHRESPEMNEETPEMNYGTPEANYERPEDMHETEEMNQEVPEENQELPVSQAQVSSTVGPIGNKSQTILDSSILTGEGTVEIDGQKQKEPSIDTVIEGIYEIVKPTSPEPLEEGGEEDVVLSGESKSTDGVSAEKMESIEEEEEEIRFTLLGEKVAQVPRPSLTSYLKRAKVPPRASLQQLGSLYDALSKDARKQGFGRYTGYSDEVLRALETSAEGGMGPQLKRILEKLLERGELTREDARKRTGEALEDLDNPGSELSKDMRRLLPLRYSS